MDIETIKQLQSAGAGIALMLKEVNYRNMHHEWHLIAMFEVLDRLGKKTIPATITLEISKARHSIVQKCELIGVSFADVPLAATGRHKRAKASRPARGQCQRSCHLCSKTDFDSASDCYNSSVFSVGVGDWVCNLTTPFQGHKQ